MIRGFDKSERLSAEEIFVGKSSRINSFWNKQRLVPEAPGKARMSDTVEQLIREYGPDADTLKFMSLPGKFWRFEYRLNIELREKYPDGILFTGFERDHKVILAGTGYAPRTKSTGRNSNPRTPGFREFEALNTKYFRTNRARWLNMDINDALILSPKFFAPRSGNPQDCFNWFLDKFCSWDACWIDYFSPATTKMGAALSNLHWHLNPEMDRVPVAVTIMKGRSTIRKGKDLQGWLAVQLGGAGSFPSVSFRTLDYFEYNDSGATMVNIAGLIQRT